MTDTPDTPAMSDLSNVSSSVSPETPDLLLEMNKRLVLIEESVQTIAKSHHSSSSQFSDILETIVISTITKRLSLQDNLGRLAMILTGIVVTAIMTIVKKLWFG
jgi:predicted MarR family transcription regulator